MAYASMSSLSLFSASKPTLSTKSNSEAIKTHHHYQQYFRRRFIKGSTLFRLRTLVPTALVEAKHIGVGSYLPPSTVHSSFLAIQASSKDTPALRPELFGEGILKYSKRGLISMTAFSSGPISLLMSVQSAQASEYIRVNPIFEVGELFELGIQLSYLLLLLGLLGVGTFFVIRQVLVRRELDLSAKELQEQVRSGDASATELFELGAVMLRRKFYPAAIKYLQQAIEKWDGDDQDLAQVYNALGVSYIRDGKTDKAISQFQNAVKLQPGYVTAWNNLGDAYEKKQELQSALKAFEEVLLFDPNNKVARPRREYLKDKVKMYKGVAVQPKQR